MLLFELTVVNNWHVLASGFVLVSSRYAYIFFVVFNIFSSIMILNIVVAFILEVFQLQFDIDKYARRDPVQARLDELAQRSRVDGRWQASTKGGG